MSKLTAQLLKMIVQIQEDRDRFKVSEIMIKILRKMHLLANYFWKPKQRDSRNTGGNYLEMNFISIENKVTQNIGLCIFLRVLLSKKFLQNTARQMIKKYTRLKLCYLQTRVEFYTFWRRKCKIYGLINLDLSLETQRCLISII